ncbi:hypothetical protein [Streptomyces sp. NPDC001270]|uniref:hypothetical protein n=1 Tax=Streptomyces sp. NPDC001270 TaxID=3364554 RepID=UPI0036A92E1A
MSNTKRTQQSTPPKAGARPSIRVDDGLAADLAVLMSTGANLSDAIRAAVRQAADIHRTAWANGVVPEGTAPRLLAYQLQQQRTPSDAPASAYDASTRPRPTGRPIGRRIPAPPAPRILRP